MPAEVKINCSQCVFMVMKEHVTQGNSVAHICVFLIVDNKKKQ